MSVKRKHIEFADGQGPSQVQDANPLQRQPAGPHIHPSRIHQAPAPKVKKPKNKTDAKKRYLAKKARRHKILSKAKKAAAPKDKNWQPNGEDDSSDTGSDSDSDDDGDGTLKPQEITNAQAGPSRLPSPPPAAPATSAKTAKSTIGANGDEDANQAVVDEAAERERRKREKREKRANRDKTEKRKRKEEKRKGLEKGKEREEEAPLPVKEQEHEVEVNEPTEAQSDVAMEVNDSDDVEEIQDAEDEEDGTNNEALHKADNDRISPPPLEAFPLPTPAPAPDRALLWRQGLPANLQNATFIDQDLKLPIGDIEIEYPERKEMGLGKMEKRLQDMGVDNLFAVQAAMLPYLMKLPLVPLPGEELDDYLVSAPTGSGKTLAYTIPIIHILSTRKVTRLRALIVLPTRDLVGQVRETIETLSKGTGLTVGSVTGQHSFTHEQNMIIANQKERLLGGSSKIDILIATPGRLMDHIQKTPNFSLQHLRFLVIDEADRLLNQSFHNWLSSVLSHTRPPTTAVELPEGFTRKPWDCIASNWHVAYGLTKGDNEWDLSPISTKLLFSATLTRDPAAIASLQLRNPQYFIVQSPTSQSGSAMLGETFALPVTLTERYVVVPSAYKPLHLIHLIHHPEYPVRNGLVFTKSVESVGRLVSLLERFEAGYKDKDKSKRGKVVIKGYTSEMKPGERKTILADFSSGKVHLLVCSDVIARGMDLPTVENVVSYDTPVDMRKYVHRVGRTARAGRAGTAWTLVEKQEALHFKSMLKAAGHDGKVKKMRAKEDDMTPYKEAYDVALRKTKEVYSRHD